MKIPYLFLAFFACLSLLSSCGGDTKPAPPDPSTLDSDRDGVMDDKDHCNGTHASLTGWPVDQNGCPVQLDIEFVIDGSKSMKGYVSRNTEFLNYLLDVKSNLDNFSNSANAHVSPSDSIWSEPDTAMVSNTNTEAITTIGKVRYTMIADPRVEMTNGEMFLEALEENSFEGKESQLDDIFKELAQGMTHQRLVVMLTDGILSYSSDDIKKDTEVNIKGLEKLGGKISKTLSDYFGFQKSYAMALLAGTSEFKGTYYNYKNVHFENCCNEPRPYYVFLMGQPWAIKFYLSEMNRRSNRIKEAYYFNMDFDLGKGFITEESSGHYTFDEPAKEQTITAENYYDFTKRQEDPSKEKDTFLTITFHVDLSFLANAEAINEKDVEIIFGSKTLRPTEIEIGESAKVNFKVPTKDLAPGNSYPIKVRLNQREDWLVNSWHLSNDAHIDSVQSKTFGLRHLFQGISKGESAEKVGKITLGEGQLKLEAVKQ